MAIGLWRNCSNRAHMTAANPMGVASDILASPLAVVRDDWIPKIDAAAESLGYKPDFIAWMIYGQVIVNNIMCADSWVSLINRGVGKPFEYQPAFLELVKHCRDFYVYHGAPSNLAEVPTGAIDDYRWLGPTMLAGAIPVYDAQGDKVTPAMQRLAAMHKRRRQRFAVEPFVKPGTQWAADEVPCFVMLSKVRQVIAADWSAAQGAVKDYPYTNVLVGKWEELGEEEARGYLDRGWNVFYPINTPVDFLARFRELPNE